MNKKTMKNAKDTAVFLFMLVALIGTTAMALYWQDAYSKKDTLCDSRVASAIARMHQSNATYILFPKQLEVCAATAWGADYGYNCFNASDNLTMVLEVYSK